MRRANPLDWSAISHKTDGVIYARTGGTSHKTTGKLFEKPNGKDTAIVIDTNVPVNYPYSTIALVSDVEKE